MVSTTRCTSCDTLVSRSGDPSLPWKYLLATMLVAVCDQSTGTSISRCSKMTAPLSLPIEAVRVSHWTSSYGFLPASSRAVKYRGNAIPVFSVLCADFAFVFSIFALVVAIEKSLRSSLRHSAPISSGRSRILSICSVLVLQRRCTHDHTNGCFSWGRTLRG